MEPNALAVLAGGAGALLMLLLVLLAVVGFAWPIVRAVVRFAGNFQSVRLVRHDNGIAFDGKVDDWREGSDTDTQMRAEVQAASSALESSFDKGASGESR